MFLKPQGPHAIDHLGRLCWHVKYGFCHQGPHAIDHLGRPHTIDHLGRLCWLVKYFLSPGGPCYWSSRSIRNRSNVDLKPIRYRSKNNFKIEQRSIKNRSKIDRKSTKHRSKIDQNRCPKIDQKSIENRPNIDQKSIKIDAWRGSVRILVPKNRSELKSGGGLYGFWLPGASCDAFGTSFMRFWRQHRPNLGPKMAPSWGPNR